MRSLRPASTTDRWRVCVEVRAPKKHFIHASSTDPAASDSSRVSMGQPLRWKDSRSVVHSRSARPVKQGNNSKRLSLPVIDLRDASRPKNRLKTEVSVGGRNDSVILLALGGLVAPVLGLLFRGHTACKLMSANERCFLLFPCFTGCATLLSFPQEPPHDPQTGKCPGERPYADHGR